MSVMPHICGVCCTYGRTKELSEAVACFHAQKYDGKKTLVIYNSLVNQSIIYEHPEVIVVNASIRPLSMGATRNEAIKHAPNDALLVVWDDDDRYTSGHLANFARGFDMREHGWVRHSRQFHMEAGFLKSIVYGSANTVAFTKAAWAEVGGYNEMNTGEDQQFIGRITAKFPGVMVELADDELSFMYGWGQGIYHLSGAGPDKVGVPNGMVRCGDYVRQRQEAMYEPTGEVLLKPKLLKDYDAMAAAFVKGVTKLSNSRRGKVALCSLGHAGDLMNVLPIALHIYRTTGQKPLFVTSKMYGDVLDGVSYVEAVKLDLHDKDIKRAIAEAEKRAETVLVTQVHGDGYQVDRVCDSYTEEAWRMAGMLDKWDSEWMTLLFDRRDKEREKRLLDAVHFDHPSETVLINLRGGFSSPFPGAEAFQTQLISEDQKHLFYLDLAQIKAERIYDMLAILERGAVLVTSDTYTVHLAAACDIPVIAILNDNPQPFGRPWLRTKPRCNVILEVGYSEALQRIGEINGAIESITK